MNYVMLQPFESKTVISFLKQYETTGHSPYLVLTDDFERYVLKSPLRPLDKSSIVREFICNKLMQVWGIKTPTAVSLCLSEILLQSEYVQKNNQLKQNKLFFGSLFQPNSIDLNKFISADLKKNQSMIINIESILDIALFDIWVENDDRKPSNSNILLKPIQKAFEIIPIDNALTFASMTFESLNASYVSFSDNDSILLSPLGLTAIRRAKKSGYSLSDAKEKFYLCIAKSRHYFFQICEYLPETYALNEQEAVRLKLFLFNDERNKKVFEQFVYIFSTAK